MPSIRPSFFSRFLVGCSLMLAGLGNVAVAATLPSGAEILAAMQKNAGITSDVTASVNLTQQKSGQGIKTFEMLYYRRDSDDAFLIVFKAPEAEKGNGYLRMGDNFWMYRRNTRTFQHVNRDENIGGTDAQGDDFEDRPITELYEVAKDSTGKETLVEEDLGKIAVYRFDIKAKVHDVDYPRKTLWVRRDNFLPLKELSYANSGALMQTAYFLKYTPVQGHFLAVEQIFIDEFEKGNRTKLQISEIQTTPITKDIFTKAYLENLSK
jgi:outer membrane lipoprotein-sorting protein